LHSFGVRGGRLTESALSTRSRILALLAREPGLHLRAVPARLDLSLRTVRYHLATLEDEGAVVTYRSGRRVYWYPAKLLSHADVELIAALRVRGEHTLLQILLNDGPSRFSSLEKHSRLAPRSLSRHLRSLMAVGIVTVDENRMYAVADPIRVARQLEGFRIRFPDLIADAAREIFDSP